VLLCHRRDHDVWCQPGGGRESGEPPGQGVVRETREETGLEVMVERLVGVYCWPQTDDVIFSFRCIAVSGSLTLNDEARDLRYFALDALPANLFAEHAERIRDAVHADGPALLRTPTGPSAPDEIRLRLARVKAIARRADETSRSGE
jgi:ADP-ribose pyrophosphatase YjhB (NUDIX family)